MAGTKETPRQKLINLMYLVLLAMLALQVSSVIIEKFQQLNASLENSIELSDKRNDGILKQIQEAVAKGKFAKEDVKLMEAAQTIRKETLQLLAYLHDNKKQLIHLTGGVDEYGHFHGAKEEEPVAHFMLGAGDSKNGKAYELQNRLNTYAHTINNISKARSIDFNIEKLALDGGEDPLFRNNPEQKRKTFAQLNFEGTPLVAALAVLSEKANKIVALEAELLSKMAVKIGAVNIPVDKVRPVVLTGTNRLLAGTEFEAELFMAAYSSNFQPEMTFNNTPLPVGHEGVGKIKFKASGGEYNADGVIKKTWIGSIKYPKSGGGDTVYKVMYDYYVLKPVIEDVSSVSAKLYKDCGNEMRFKVPGLGADFLPEFKVTGAVLKQTANRGQVVIIPDQPQVEVKVFNKDTYIGSKSYKVLLIPKPDIIIKCNEKLVDPIRGVPISDLTKVEVIPVPNSEFNTTNPRDARYRTVYWKAELVRNGKLKGSITINDQRGNLRDLEALSNDRIIISEVKVKRKNFEDKTLDVEIGKPVLIIPVQ